MAVKKRVVIFRVTLDLPERATAQEAQDYVATAVKNWAGGMDADQHMTHLDPTTVRVTTPRALR